MNIHQWVSLGGIVVLMGLAWLLSKHRKSVSPRTIFWSVALQFAFAVIILKTAPGLWFFAHIGAVVNKLLDFQTDGARFVFGSSGTTLWYEVAIAPAR